MTRPQIARPIPPPAPDAVPAARLRWLVPTLLALLYLTQCAWFIRTQSLTYDEPVHIAEGLNAWRYGRFEQYNDHPPLARLWCTLPLIGPKWQVEIQQLPDSFRVTRIAPDPVSLAWRARAMNVLLGLALAGLVWWAADRLFSSTAANFALALFAFSPSLIAHFSIAATDGAATLFIFATAWGLVRWRREPTWQKTSGLGLLLGLMLLAKFSTAPMFVLALLWMLLLGADKVVQSAHEVELGQDRGGAAARVRGGLGRILFSCSPPYRPRWHFDRHFSQLEPADRQACAREKLQLAGSGRRIHRRLPGTGPS